ncbi:MAG: RHS repeat domain-containing protein [Bacteroidota bacterium]
MAKYFRSIIILLLFYLVGIELHAQNSTAAFKDIIPPSPTVAGLMRFEETPVSLPTGIPDITLPLYTKNLPGGVAFNLSLRYNPTAIRVEERSSWAGKGWNLMAGGSISRTIKDIPDESSSLSLGPDRIGVWHNGYFNYSSFSDEVRDEFLFKVNLGREKYDGEPDLFQYSFMGMSGRFIVVRENGALVPKLISEGERVQISLDVNANENQIEGFTIKDTKGVKFIFNVFERSTSIPVTTTHNQFGEVNYSGLGAVPTESRSAWHLTEIRLPNDELICSFQYVQITEKYNTPANAKRYKILSPTTSSEQHFFNPFTNAFASFSRNALLPQKVSSNATMDVDTQKLSAIIFRDGTSIRVLHVPGHPEFDENTGGKLNRVELLDTSGNAVNWYQFNYQTTGNDRLFLKSLVKESPTLSQTHEFGYYNSSNLPTVDSNEKDRWGYYNGSYLPGTVHPKEVKTGVLTNILYPTGGKKEFEYESNTFSYIGDEYLGDELGTPETESLQRTDTFSGEAMSNPTKTVLFRADFDQQVKLFYRSSHVGDGVQRGNHKIIVRTMIANSQDTGYDDIFSEVDFTEGTQIWSTEIPAEGPNFITKTWNSLAAGYYRIEIQTLDYFPNPAATDFEFTVDTKLNYSRIVNGSPPADKVIGGGIRIKGIRNYDRGDEQYYTGYYYNEQGETGRSSGSFDGTRANDKYNLTREHILAHWCGIDACLTQISYSYEADEDLNPLYQHAGHTNQITYKTVHKRLFSSEEVSNGRVVSTFTSPYDYPSYPEEFNYPFIRVNDKAYKQGLLLSEVTLDEFGKVLRKVENEYSFLPELVHTGIQYFEAQNIGCGWGVLHDTYDSYINLSNTTGLPLKSGALENCGSTTSFLDGQPYDLFKTRTYLTQRTTKVYDTENPLIQENRESFEYLNSNYALRRSYSDFNTDNSTYSIEDRYFYPSNAPKAHFNSAELQVFNAMENLNMIAKPVGQERIVDGETVGGQVMNYSNSGGGNYVIKEVFDLNKVDGQLQKEKRTEVHSYGPLGNPIEISTDGMPMVYVWGCDHTQPVAQVLNASQANVLAALGINTMSDIQNLGTSALETKLTQLRNNLNSTEVYTYLYDPVHGVIKKIDQNGQATHYHYDDYSRLLYTTDFDGNVLQLFEYKTLN